MADGGTLFLDEIGDMTLPMQVKILRVLQERTYERVGSNRSMRCEVRIIAATHRNLEENIVKGTFREDLFYRLNVFPIEMPALRERLEDLPLLIDDLIDAMRRNGHGSVRLSADAVHALRAYHWPGNVRELSNLIERLAGAAPAPDGGHRRTAGALPAEHSAAGPGGRTDAGHDVGAGRGRRRTGSGRDQPPGRHADAGVGGRPRRWSASGFTSLSPAAAAGLGLVDLLPGRCHPAAARWREPEGPYRDHRAGPDQAGAGAVLRRRRPRREAAQHPAHDAGRKAPQVRPAARRRAATATLRRCRPALGTAPPAEKLDGPAPTGDD